ncbi:MAG: hypothetical protein J3Q66DRAFT_351048 [Benniella sp.]|nr:MAG: hypothetical protein J3Q66DRAFT_351048 [Benniella sp.]
MHHAHVHSLNVADCFESCTSNICTRRVLAGKFQVMKWVLKDLVGCGLWNGSPENRTIGDNGFDSKHFWDSG